MICMEIMVCQTRCKVDIRARGRKATDFEEKHEFVVGESAVSLVY